MTTKPPPKKRAPRVIADRIPTAERQAFAQEWLANGGNALKAAIKTIPAAKAMTPNRASQFASRLRHHKHVKAIIEKAAERSKTSLEQALSRYDISSDRVAEELARGAFAQIRDVTTLETVEEKDAASGKVSRRQVLRVHDWNEISDDAHRAIYKVSQRPDGTVTIELINKLSALEALAKMKGYIAKEEAAPTNLVSFVIQT